MTNFPLPAIVIDFLAAPATRLHHANWHSVRVGWDRMSAPQRAAMGPQWAPPRQSFRNGGVRDPGSGTDFLFMHREMIAQVNVLLEQANDANYPRVVGWAPIPFDHNDANWPMPPFDAGGPPAAKSPAETAYWRNLVAQRYENPAWLQAVTLDDLGAEIEDGIHNWMHMHWAATRPNVPRDDPRNDYLGSTYSSHVNRAFWKLHGWIDDRIGAWEAATGTPADFTGAWSGPGHHGHNGLRDFSETPLREMDDEEIARLDSFFADAFNAERARR